MPTVAWCCWSCRGRVGRRENKADFEGFLGEEFAKYCAIMERPGTWGDELTLVCAACLLRAQCDVHASDLFMRPCVLPCFLFPSL